MRLAIVRQRYSAVGGAERFVERALAPLAAAGVAIDLYSRSWPQRLLSDARRVRIDPPYAGRLWRDWSFARAVCKALAGERETLVQSHERIACCDIFRAGDGVHAVWLAERGRHLGRLRRWTMAVNPYHAYVCAAERRMFGSARLKAVICNSRMVRDEIRQRFAVPEERLHVIYSAVDAARFSPELAQRERAAVRARLDVPATGVLFLLVGSGYERKGVAAAIAAVARVPDAHLAVVGRDSRPARYAALARASGAAARVHIVGPTDDPLPFYGAADAFLLPTLYDPLPSYTSR